jgi:hypothetical protein
MSYKKNSSSGEVGKHNKIPAPAKDKLDYACSTSKGNRGNSVVMDRLTDEFQAVFIGIAEADEVYGVVMFAKRGPEPISAIAKIMFYIFSDGEIYNVPISGVDVVDFDNRSYMTLYKSMKKSFMSICESVTSCGINIYAIRNSVYTAAQLRTPTMGKIAIHKKRGP